MYDELLILVEEKKLMKLVINCVSGLDLDCEKLFEKVCILLCCLCCFGMVIIIGDMGKFCIIEVVFCFGVDVCLGGDVCEV